MRRFKGSTRFVSGILLTFVVLIGSGSASATSEATEQAATIVIGMPEELSGPLAAIGQTELWGAETAIDVVNGNHRKISLYYGKGRGLPRLGGAPLKLVARDTQGSGALAHTISDQLITQDKAVFLVGAVSSGSAAVIQPVAEQYGIPYVSLGTAPSLTAQGYKTFFRVGPSDVTLVGSLIKFVDELPDHVKSGPLKSAGIISCDNVFCQGVSTILENRLSRIRLKIKVNLTTKSGSTTMSSEAQRLRAANPDVLFMTQLPADATILQNAMKQTNWTPKVAILIGGAWDDAEWMKSQESTNGAAGWIGRSPTASEIVQKNPNWPKINRIYRKYSNGQDMNNTGLRAFTQMMWAADVINRAGSTRASDLLTAARATNTTKKDMLQDCRGIKFNAVQQNIYCSGVVAQIGWDNQTHLIYPWEDAAKLRYRIIYPNPTWRQRAAHK